ncbi:MAG TPA: helix-turn-helix transcriptional regulator [Anaerohalosphaeraceae bacterium]|jgi:transcriptional regulator with XRE-family HTH domain|nr:helix-turn-helix transcriptional regulator [Anaerohalosphaeraceae bacterium]HRT51846.1 helix-turn-helix transcriptional regulator [Anaerohalosphaeraceae bacterium]HRT87864.1 helix-turn-helix transcriptional regulator [Anaerohalosphaeraceae bacterium]
MTTGEIIRRIRMADGVTQAKLARSLKVSRLHLAQIETGRRQPDMILLRRVARRFRLPLPLLVLCERPYLKHDELFGLLREILERLLRDRTNGMKDRNGEVGY